MRSNRAILLMFLLTTLGLGCMSQAGHDDYDVGVVRVRYCGFTVRGADPDTFQRLEVDREAAPWGRDHKRGYFRNIPVEDSDGATFQAVDDRFAKDANHVYVGHRKKNAFGGSIALARRVDILDEADPETFRIWRHSMGAWHVDKDHVFVGTRILEGADPATLRLLPITWGSHLWIADANHVYKGGKLVKHADPNSLRVHAETGDLVDDHFVYFGYRLTGEINGVEVPASSASWRRIGQTAYRTDGRFVFFYGHQVKGIDAKSCVPVSRNYVKDANHVWHDGRVYEGDLPVDTSH